MNTLFCLGNASKKSLEVQLGPDVSYTSFIPSTVCLIVASRGPGDPTRVFWEETTEFCLIVIDYSNIYQHNIVLNCFWDHVGIVWECVGDHLGMFKDLFGVKVLGGILFGGIGVGYIFELFFVRGEGCLG